MRPVRLPKIIFSTFVYCLLVGEQVRLYSKFLFTPVAGKVFTTFVYCFGINEIQKFEQNHDYELDDDLHVEFECQDVKIDVNSSVIRKIDDCSQRYSQDTIKIETAGVVKEELVADDSEDLNANVEGELGQRHKIAKEVNRGNKLRTNIDVANNSIARACDKREKTFMRKRPLEVHPNSVHDDITHPCHICGKSFGQKSYLKIHTNRLHNNFKHYQCDDCQKLFTTKADLKIHVDSVHHKIRHGCDTCGKSFRQKVHLKVHIESVHRKIRHPCDICQKTFAHKRSLKKHIETVHNGVTHECDICGNDFKRRCDLKTQLMHHKIRHACDMCEKTYSDKSSLKKHIDSVHHKIMHPCNKCQKTFSERGSLKRHIDSVHKRVGHACTICQKTFSDKSNLKAHIKAIHSGASHACDICGNVFKRRGILKTHVNFVHHKITHPCDICQKTFTQKRNLKIHIDFVHNKITHPCNKCQKTFSDKSNLKAHIRAIHNGVRHECDICGKIFSLKGNLKKHIDSVHNGVSHACDICGNVFKRRSDLKIHVDSVHHNIRHGCDTCGKSFRQKVHLKVHIDSVHRDYYEFDMRRATSEKKRKKIDRNKDVVYYIRGCIKFRTAIVIPCSNSTCGPSHTQWQSGRPRSGRLPGERSGLSRAQHLRGWTSDATDRDHRGSLRHRWRGQNSAHEAASVYRRDGSDLAARGHQASRQDLHLQAFRAQRDERTLLSQGQYRLAEGNREFFFIDINENDSEADSIHLQLKHPASNAARFLYVDESPPTVDSPQPQQGLVAGFGATRVELVRDRDTGEEYWRGDANTQLRSMRQTTLRDRTCQRTYGLGAHDHAVFCAQVPPYGLRVPKGVCMVKRDGRFFIFI
ncbi:unnamed protein product [Trichogramma brassicae]|uniref:C2H2-type domain-containing protein n=1 Tax=Trichogramma brassicae TaxID=86971 RepID=A0A6H5I6Y3_9HYME|nr:unnamed protein product [Trichogramma brassicae]